MTPAVASPAAASRSTRTTLAPLFAKASAVARPMPFPAPVISATLPVKSRSMAFLLLFRHSREGGNPGATVSSAAPCSRQGQALGPAFAGVTIISFPADEARPLLEGHQQIADEPAPGLVGEAAFGVEFGLRLADQHLGLVQGVHVEKDAAAPQIVLRARRAGHAGGRPHDRHRLAGEGLIGRTRGPI